VFDEIMICLRDMQDALYESASFCEVAGLSHKASDSCADFTAEPIDIRDADFIIGRVAYDFSFVNANNFPVDFVSNFLSERDAIFVEMRQDCVLVLVIPVGTEVNLVFVIRLLAALRDESVELIA
jgi:hypothetical protein